MHDYRSPRWLRGGNAQTIWPALFGRRHHGPPTAFRRERWTTPDHDFVDADWLGEDRDAPLLVMFHGLEGSSLAHYMCGLADKAWKAGWNVVRLNQRNCGNTEHLSRGV